MLLMRRYYGHNHNLRRACHLYLYPHRRTVHYSYNRSTIEYEHEYAILLLRLEGCPSDLQAVLQPRLFLFWRSDRQENRSDPLTFLLARDWDFRSDQGRGIVAGFRVCAGGRPGWRDKDRRRRSHAHRRHRNDNNQRSCGPGRPNFRADDVFVRVS